MMLKREIAKRIVKNDQMVLRHKCDKKEEKGFDRNYAIS
jgi:hypothetical protein